MSTLYWHSHIYTITAEANKLLRLLKRTFLYLTDTSTRRTLYLSPVKSQLCHATQVWSPAQVSLKAQVERVQRRYQMDLTKPDWRDVLDLLPLTYDRELKDLVFLNKWLFNHTHLDVHSFTKIITHGPTKFNNFFNSKTLICKTSAFQASYFNRILKL